MSIIQLDSGEWVNVPDGTPPERIAQIKSGAPSGRGARPAGTPRKQVSEAEQRANKRKSGGWLDDTLRGAVKGATLSFGDEISGGLSAAANSVGNIFGLGNGKSFGDEYRTQRDAERILDTRAAQNSPIANTVGEIAGAVVNPIGTGARLLKGASVAARATGLTRAAEGLASGAARVSRAGPVAQAALVGANQGALNGIGAAKDMANVPGAALEGGLVGGTVGGAVGGAFKLGTGAMNAVRDRSAAAAERMAYTKVGERLKGARVGPIAAQDEIAVANAAGNDMRVMDLTPGTRADAAYYSRKPGLDASNDIRAVGDDRLAARGERVTKQIDDTAKRPEGGTDSNDLIDRIVQQRKAQGKADYAVGGALDAPVNWSPELDKFFADAPADTLATMRRAREEIAGRRGNPDDWIAENPDGTMTIVPSMRTFDYLKRGFDTEIGIAKRAGDGPKVQRLQSELSDFKTLFAQANENDEYAQLLLRQRTGFERQQAVEQGQKYLSRLTSGRQGAREIMKEINALKPHQKEEARTAILDGLLGLDVKAQPLNVFRTFMRNPKQREVMEFAFGGKAELDKFTTYLNRELRSANADAMVSGPQSITSAVQLAGEGADETLGGVFNQVLRGYAFGGAAGAASGAFRQFGSLASGMGKNAQEAYGRILAGDGTGLAEGVAKADQFARGRAERLARRSRKFAKGAQQPYTDILGRQ